MLHHEINSEYLITANKRFTGPILLNTDVNSSPFHNGPVSLKVIKIFVQIATKLTFNIIGPLHTTATFLIF